ncbi:MAG: ADP-ribosylglycohydrolase family protein [Rhizonema sp. NSF051]|nr:ADP-ribosylglycohydrolase family protein [Rhizonema sp. NSF051]
MRYSLSSRFKGTIIGTLLGEIILNRDSNLPFLLLPHVQKIMEGAESLIELGRFDFDDWLKRQQQKCLNSNTSDDILLEAILNTIPVILFFHENTTKLRQNLQQVVDILPNNLVVQDGILAIGYAIAMSLTEKLTPHTLIPETVAFLGETPSNLPQQLLKVNDLLTQGAGLEKVQAEFSKEEELSHVIPIAFYCFLSTLEDFRLSLLRSHQIKSRSLTLSMITGALSGAYNSTGGIPVTWQILLSQTELLDSRVNNFSLLLNLADMLLAVWSGVYNSDIHLKKVIGENAVAAPRVIRLR